MASYKRSFLSKIFSSTNPLLKNFPKDQERVLMYHRVIKPENLSYPIEAGMYVRPETFELQIKFLNKHFTVVSLEEYVKNITMAKANRLVALTFDDGWIDFYENAYPILKSYKTKSSVFLPTKFIGSKAAFWSDKLAGIVFQIYQKNLLNAELVKIISPFLPEHQDIQISSQAELIQLLLSRLKSKSPQERESLLNKLANLASFNEEDLKAPHFMSWDQIKELRDENLTKFYCHSHLHEISTNISLEELEVDLQTSLNCLKTHEIASLGYFCYPNEIRTPETDKVLRRQGFTHSLARLNYGERNADLPIPCITRIGIHDDITNNEKLFSFRLLGL